LYELTDAYAPVSRDEEVALTTRASDGDVEARDKLVLHNLRLVMDIARQFGSSGAEFEDLVHEGIAGLIRAIDRFEPERGLRFSTYAHWWIRQGVSRFVKGPTRVIRIPEYLIDKVARVYRARDAGEDDPEMLAAAAGVAPEELEEMLQLTQAPVSLDAPPAGPEMNIREGLPDVAQATPENQAIRLDDVRRLGVSLSVLNLREQKLLLMRYAQGGRRPVAYRKVAPDLGVTPERARQLERRALEKLREALEPRREPPAPGRRSRAA
jgi:RNA polymerase sigma factor (sigma-70 family)